MERNDLEWMVAQLGRLHSELSALKDFDEAAFFDCKVEGCKGEVYAMVPGTPADGMAVLVCKKCGRAVRYQFPIIDPPDWDDIHSTMRRICREEGVTWPPR